MLKWNGAPYTFEAFSELADALAARRAPDSPSFLHNLQKGVLDHFFGMDWLEKYGSLAGNTKSYLWPEFDEQGEATDFSMRLLNLAEMLFNLQTVVGVRNPLEDIANGQIEPGLAELQAGMLLAKSGRAFHYVDRTAGVRTYDLEVRAEGQVWPVEVKCKLDRTDLSENAIIGALRKAHDQLPPDDSGRGVVFMRCPKAWTKQGEGRLILPPETVNAVNQYLKSTRRIGLVASYVFHYQRRESDLLVTNLVREVPSHRHPSLLWWERPLLPMDHLSAWQTWPRLVERWQESRSNAQGSTGASADV